MEQFSVLALKLSKTHFCLKILVFDHIDWIVKGTWKAVERLGVYGEWFLKIFIL